MSNKRNFFRDRFTFSLRGMTATASLFISPVIADHTINRYWDQKYRPAKCRKHDPLQQRTGS